MDDSRRSNPIFALIVTCSIIGGAVFFAQNYEVEGLDGLKIRSKSTAAPKSEGEVAFDIADSSFADPSFADRSFAEPSFSDPSFAEPSFADKGLNYLGSFLGKNSIFGSDLVPPRQFVSVDDRGESNTARGDSDQGSRRPRNLRLASWALNGFGPSKLNQAVSRRNFVRLIRQFDVVCLQQITSIERDLVPRMVDAINEGGYTFDYLIGEPTGPIGQAEQLAIVFNTDRVKVDRTQTYTVDDPHQQMTYDPLVAWFQATQPSTENAWTFSLVNVHVDLNRASAEVALLPGILSSIRSDGRGEDDVVLAGLLQADDEYLISQVMSESTTTAVRSAPTDIFGRHQTCNILVDRNHTTEYIGRGGPVDFLRLYNLSLSEAEIVSSYLPVFADFAATEGGL